MVVWFYDGRWGDSISFFSPDFVTLTHWWDFGEGLNMPEPPK